MVFAIGQVTFGIEHTPLHRILIQFEWAEPFGEFVINSKNRSIFGDVDFRREKNVCLPTRLGAKR